MWTRNDLILSGGTFNNNGSFTANAAITSLSCYGNGVFNNIGTFISENGEASFFSQTESVPFNNSGTVNGELVGKAPDRLQPRFFDEPGSHEQKHDSIVCAIL